MNLDLNKITEKMEQGDFIKKFIKELSEAIEKFNSKEKMEVEKMDDIELTQEEDLEFYRRESKFLQDFFKNELSDISKGEIFIVTDKFENDDEYHRFKIAQYKDNKEYKFVKFEKDLPENVQVGDVVRKINGCYVYDEQATKQVKDFRDKTKQEILNERNTWK